MNGFQTVDVFFFSLSKCKCTIKANSVKMGLISHNAAVTGQKWTRTSYTYTLDTLERDAEPQFKSGFRTGIFFKALKFSMG
jgi:hypothetical protein